MALDVNNTDESHTLERLPPELLMLVAEEIDAPCIARFAAASTVCLAAAQGELRAALRTAVQRCLEPGAGPISDACIACPYFHLPDDLVDLPEGAFRGSALTKLEAHPPCRHQHDWRSRFRRLH